MKLYKNKIFQIVVFVLLILIIVNPSYTKFKEFAQEPTNNKSKIVYKRIFNGLIFSIYQKQIFDIEYDESTTPEEPEKYWGFCMNFFRIENNQIPKPKQESVPNNLTDSTMVVPTDTSILK